MSRFRCATLAAVSVFGFASVASAADMPVKAIAPVPVASNWTGFYVGLNGGYGWGTGSATTTPVGATAIADMTAQSVSGTGQGTVFGGQLGYNWQMGATVVGLEADFDGGGISGTQNITYPSLLNPASATNSFTATEKLNWLATIRGRLGYTWTPAALVYITAGAAWENYKIDSITVAETSPSVYGSVATGSSSKTNTGWVLGGGLEWMVAPKWTVRGEYLYYGFNGSNSQSLAFQNCAVAGCGVNVSSKLDKISVLRTGVNYKF